jgi:phospholipid/cholesterol/gamma-HCH transport system ATP-binding protein
LNIVEVSHLSAGYEGTRVVNDVSLTIPKGKVTAILGSSGCGKTTLLKTMIRLNDAYEGSVRFFGQDVLPLEETDFNRILRRVGVLFQNGAMLNSIDVAENVAIPLQQHTDLPGALIRRLVQVKLHLVGLDYASRKLPSELSGGMRKRAALARAIALDPELLFCDEPSAGLDPITAASLDRLILRMRDELGMTVVMITHAVPSIVRIADRVVFMGAGEVVFEGPLEEARSSGIALIEDFFEKG